MKKTQKKGKLRGLVDLEKVSVRMVNEKLVEIGITEETLRGQSINLKAEILVDWYNDRMQEAKKSASGVEFAICENCGGPVEVEDPAQRCHFCGTGFDETEPPVDIDKIDPVEYAVDLDAAVLRVRNVIADGLQNSWRLGRELCGIFDNKLYKKRLDAEGNAIYSSWDQFAETELNLSGARARAFMDVARDFTEEHVVTLGVEKLRTIRRLPPNRRAEFIAKAPELTTRALANAVAAFDHDPVTPPAPKVEPQTPKERVAENLKKGTEAAKKAREEKKQERQAQVDAGTHVTAAFQLGEYDLPLEPEGDDDYIATQTLVNGVVVTYTIKPGGKNPYMHVKLERGS